MSNGPKFKVNKEQEEAIATTSGRLILISCPGSGKTTTLIRRIHSIIEKGADPKKVLMVTFANSAAKDMNDRYKKMYGKNPGIVFATIHSLCFNVLREDGGYGKESLLLEHEKQEFFLDYIKGNPNINDAWELTKNVITEVSRIKNNYVDLKTYTPQSCEKGYFLELYRAYEKEKKSNGKIDFDDMLSKCAELLRTDEKVLKKWQNRFDYIQCDEYQDTNNIQKDILYMLSERTGNLCVVGDDDQSIYRFRGADSSIMIAFPTDFPDAKKIFMSTNYRSAQKIVDMADMCIRRNKIRFEKDFISKRGEEGAAGSVSYKTYQKKSHEMDALVLKIKELHEKGIDYKDMAVLVRTNRLAAGPVTALSEDGIPYDSTENVTCMYDDWMFKDIEAYIKLSMGDDVESNFMHILNRPNRYLKPAAFRKVPFELEAMLSAIGYLMREEIWKYDSARNSLIDLYTAFGPGRITKETPTKELFEKLVGKNGIKYDKYVKQSALFRKQNENEALEELEQLKEDAIKHRTVGEWLNHARKVSFMMKENNKKKDVNGVQITTMHKSKGMEWGTVFLVGVNNGVIPSRHVEVAADYEEERRILYVAMTRAKDNLYITCSGMESPFMEETTHDLKEKYKPTIKKRLAGSPVRHIKYGKGRVKSYSEKYVVIHFDDAGDKKFTFPDVFRSNQMEYV